MAIDFQRMAAAAVDAALNEDSSPAQQQGKPQKSKRGGHLKGVGTVAAGAALLVAGRAAVKKAPRLPVWFVERKLPDMPDLDELVERARDLWDDLVADYDEEEEPEAEGDEEIDAEAEEIDDDPDAEAEDDPDAEAEDDTDAEAEDDIDAEAEDDVDAEAEDEGDGEIEDEADFDEEEADDDVDDADEVDEDEDESDDPEAEADDDYEDYEDEDIGDLDADERVDPAARPPKPPRRSRSKAKAN
jgi:hypothetical protein